MAQEKSASPLPKLRPLPIRVARLHSKLLIAALVGIAVIAILPDDWRLPTRLLVGWNIGIALYLADDAYDDVALQYGPAAQARVRAG